MSLKIAGGGGYRAVYPSGKRIVVARRGKGEIEREKATLRSSICSVRSANPRQAGRPLSPGNTTFSRRPMDVRPTAHQFACTTKQRGGNHRPGATLSSLLNECMEKAPSRSVGSSQTPGMRASGLQKSNQSGGERPEPPVLSLSPRISPPAPASQVWAGASPKTNKKRPSFSGDPSKQRRRSEM